MSFFQRFFGSKSSKENNGQSIFTTKKCPKCNAEISLNAVICEYCDTKQKPDDVTCGSGETTAAAAKAFFTKERNNALKAGSKSYIWCSSSGACERCRMNHGKEFRWDKEPLGGHAGAVKRCSCIPLAVIPGTKQRPLGKPRWQQEQEAFQPARDIIAQNILATVRGLLAEHVAPERIVLRHFWSREYLVIDNNVKQPILAVEMHNPEDKKAIFFSKPDENLARGGSSRVGFATVADLEKHRPKLEAALKKFL